MSVIISELNIVSTPLRRPGKTVMEAATENGDKDLVKIVKLRIAIQEAKEEDKNGKLRELLDDVNKIENGDI